MNFFKNKKAEELVSEEVIFIILNTVFFVALVIFIIRATSSDNSIEEQYAKTIALTLDQMRPGSEFVLNVTDLYEAAKKNKYAGENGMLIMPIENGKVTIKVSSGAGYSFSTFNSIKPQISFDNPTKLLTIKT